MFAFQLSYSQPNTVLSNFGFSVGALILCLTLLWAISYKIKDASIIDIFWGAGFGVVALVCAINSGAHFKLPYMTLLAALPLIWAVRLSLYLAKRNLGHGEDKRYIAMQKRAEKKGISEDAWRKRSFFTIFLGQGLLITIVSAPIWVALGTAKRVYIEEGPSGELMGSIFDIGIGPLAIIGAALWLIGFLFEAIGDLQLSRFITKNKNYDGPLDEKPVLDTGLWKYTRHPNYFGNACMWWGIYIVACQAPWGWATFPAPLIMTLLLTRVSGRDLLERNMKKRKTYRDYIERTSGFFPMPRKS